MKKEIYLVFREDFVLDKVNGDGKRPLWCCSSKSNAISDVKDLSDKFLKDKEVLGLSYDMKYGYELLDLYTC